MLSLRRVAAVSPLAGMAMRRTAAATTTQQLRSFATAVGEGEGEGEASSTNKTSAEGQKKVKNDVKKDVKITYGVNKKSPPRGLPPRTSPPKPTSPTPLFPHLRENISGESVVTKPGDSKLGVSSEPAVGGPAVDGELQSAKFFRDFSMIDLRFKGLQQPVSVSTLWLRDTCTCPQCVTPSSGQKTFHTHDLMPRPHVEECNVVTDAATGRTSLRVVWAAVPEWSAKEAENKGDAENKDDAPAAAATIKSAMEAHESLYDSQELLYRLAKYDPARNYPGYLPRRLWDRSTIEKALKPVSYADWMAADDGNNAEFYRGLLDLHELGILIVDNVPDSETAVKEIANQIGNIQNTFYGELFDVVSKPQAENVAYTNVFLCLHQDLLYMNDPPYIQLLHCLHNDCDGGESLFSDSVRAAVEMQVAEPWYALALGKEPVRYHYERNGHYYYNQRPVLELQHAYEHTDDMAASSIKFTAWSPPFQDTMYHWLSSADKAARKESVSFETRPKAAQYKNLFKYGTAAQRLAYWRAAAGRFSQRLEDPNAMLELKLQPGQCVLFNNRRVLHGRQQFNTSDGTRHLKGTYIDEQTFHSRLTNMVRSGRLPGREKTEAELKARPMGQPPFGPFPPPFAKRALLDQEQVVAMMEASGRLPAWWARRGVTKDEEEVE
ncbi:hypothetical protein Sste5346_006429 [Sporothrix stenoceras]|uniref:TauD/TfdA-like domain-containing protein n=1 Tax=Sporothrix stenoceras TaxID=5173 RepID=A0ABR3YZD2_9PEZI